MAGSHLMCICISAGVAYLDGWLFVIRGRALPELQNKVDVMNAETGEEKEISLMPDGVSWKHVCLVGHLSRLYVFFTDKYYCYFPKTSTWSAQFPLPSCRSARS